MMMFFMRPETSGVPAAQGWACHLPARAWWVSRIWAQGCEEVAGSVVR